ncbi:MAG: SHOCT domain-containing protein [Candidatus Hodarchaeales archaeon]|jgi:hypothetical protein
MEVNMSNTGTNVVKILVRGTVGLLVLWCMLLLGLTGFTFTLAGGLVTALSWIPMVYPEIAQLRVYIDGVYVLVDPAIVVLLLAFIGIVFLTLGIAFIALTVTIGKKAVTWDKKIIAYMDRTLIPSSDNRLAQLERLAGLYDRGFISEEEFQQEKENLLAS